MLVLDFFLAINGKSFADSLFEKGLMLEKAKSKKKKIIKL